MSFAIQYERLEQDFMESDIPIVVYANHAGWWDPISANLIRYHVFPNRTLYAPIDAEALKKYKILGKLGFYGLRLNSQAGAAEFLTITRQILATRNASVWITPEGRFCDVRDHSAALMPGLAHLAHRLPGVVFLPLALEYAFWNESRPQIFARFGVPITSSSEETKDWTKGTWHSELAGRLRQTQNELALAVMQRDPTQFSYIIASRPIRLGWYDYFRSWRARLSGQKFDPRHQDS